MFFAKKKYLYVWIACLSFFLCLFGALSIRPSAFAAEGDGALCEEEVQEEEVSPRGWMTYLSLSMGGEGNGEIWAETGNVFTLFPSTIKVYLQLYSSYTFQESYSTMTLENQVYTPDLNMGETLRVTAPTGGEQKYWLARIWYRFDERDWESKVTDILLYSADGVCLE